MANRPHSRAPREESLPPEALDGGSERWFIVELAPLRRALTAPLRGAGRPPVTRFAPAFVTDKFLSVDGDKLVKVPDWLHSRVHGSVRSCGRRRQSQRQTGWQTPKPAVAAPAGTVSTWPVVLGSCRSGPGSRS